MRSVDFRVTEGRQGERTADRSAGHPRYAQSTGNGIPRGE